MIEDVRDDADRPEVQEILHRVIPGIPQTAVPMSRSDGMYAPVIVRAVDDAGGLVGVALLCRPEVAAMAPGDAGTRPAEAGRLQPVMDAHSELDLPAVAPDRQKQGIGSALMSAVEARLRERGVRWWFGNVTPGFDAERLRRFTAGTASTPAGPVSRSRRCSAAPASCPGRRQPRSSSGARSDRAPAACRRASKDGANARPTGR